MRTGSVIVDLAAERGGNCELTVVTTRGATWSYTTRPDQHRG